MKYRKLRIAWSVAWGVPCALLMTLFVRSQFIEDSVFWPGTERAVKFHSLFGHMSMFISTSPPIGGFRHFKHLQEPTGSVRSGYVKDLFGFYFAHDPQSVVFDAPLWPFWLVCGVMAAAPWVRCLPWSWQFSLRTLLVATTVVAVVLVLIMWAI
jgi:hypothetical protein